MKELRTTGLVEHDGGYRLTPVGLELVRALGPLLRWAEAWGVRAARRRSEAAKRARR